MALNTLDGLWVVLLFRDIVARIVGTQYFAGVMLVVAQSLYMYHTRLITILDLTHNRTCAFVLVTTTVYNPLVLHRFS